MSNLNYAKPGTSVLLALVMGATSVFTSFPAWAQRLPSELRNSSESYSDSYYDLNTIPAGTEIPVEFNKEKIVLATNESVGVTLKVAANIRNRDREILIPYGSQIVGRILPAEGGSRFVAEKLVIRGDPKGIRVAAREYRFPASSQVVSRVETINEGAEALDILKGAVAGAGAATIIAGVTGNRRIEALEVLGGGALGALLGWVIPESNTPLSDTKDVVIIYPNTDLALTLQQDLAMN
ncbi:MAG: hypothetical protein QNJ54_27815 [Prochloraceae cyanobacterium]|nr:hypothetical protein [Prochloraceae cyanobacterium]